MSSTNAPSCSDTPTEAAVSSSTIQLPQGRCVEAYNIPAMIWVEPREGEEDSFVPCTDQDFKEATTWTTHHDPGTVAFGWWNDTKTRTVYKGTGVVLSCSHNEVFDIVAPFAEGDPRSQIPVETWGLLREDQLEDLGGILEAEERHGKLDAEQIVQERLDLVQETVETLVWRNENDNKRRNPLEPRPSSYLEDRIREMGPQLAKLNAATATAAPSSREGLVETFAPAFAYNLQLAGRDVGNICTFDGTPFISKSGRDWVYQCTGERFCQEYLQSSRLPDQPSGPIAAAADLPLPDLTFLYEEIRQYLASPLGLFFPVVDRALFDSTADAAYCWKYSSSSPGPNSARACIFSLLSLTALSVHGPRGYPLRYSDQHAREAQRLLPKVFEEPVSLDGLQIILMLCLCAQGLAGDVYTVNQLLSAAARYACYLRSHTSPAGWEKPSDGHSHTRRLFWIVYVCDKGLSMVTGLPSRVEDSHCDLDLTQYPYGDPYPGSYFHTYVQLAFIQSKIQRDLYSPTALQQPEANLLRTIRDLDHDLETWKQSLKSSNQPTFLPGERDPLQYTDVRFSIFHLQYHHCMVMIHQTSSHCASWVQNQDARDPSSSLAISVTASRSLLQQFAASCLDLGPANLLFSISYFI
ncbi:hypothetical protein BDW74DRAFT_183867 [Aspergillus multicolor]|uniref:fungal specific transcription factor domain-containing protein n=1 Tax=Aspergillus multicolor TaxID=41759 RepID=UPI003CCD90BC